MKMLGRERPSASVGVESASVSDAQKLKTVIMGPMNTIAAFVKALAASDVRQDR